MPESGIVASCTEPAAAAAEREPLLGASPEASVGVLGWLGFFIINIAAWGIIATANGIVWTYGFVACALYLAGLVALALHLEKRDVRKYRHFANLLWVLAALHIFILGLYVSFHVIPPLGGNEAEAHTHSAPATTTLNPRRFDLTELLPPNATAGLRSWAQQPVRSELDGPDFIAFGGGVFFSGEAKHGANIDFLLRAEGTNIRKVVPPLTVATSFAKFRSSLFFLAHGEGSGRGLWRIDADSSGRASLVLDSPSGPGRGEVRRIYADSAASRLYLQVDYECPDPKCYRWIQTLYGSDGTSAGTADIRSPGACHEACAVPAGGARIVRPKTYPSRTELWGMLFFAVLPMMAFAAYVLLQKEMPGPVLNLFCGVIAAGVVLFRLATYEDQSMSLDTFLKWFLTIYTSVLWVALLVWSLAERRPRAAWLEELKTWAVALVSLTFFIILHADLEIPATEVAWCWVVYALVVLLQMAGAAVVSRTVPLVASAVGLFILAGKIASELVDLFGLQSSLRMLAMLLILALQGIGIIAGAVCFAGNRDKINSWAGASLMSLHTRLCPDGDDK